RAAATPTPSARTNINMAGAISISIRGTAPKEAAARRDPAWLRWSLIGTSLGFLALFLLLPLIAVFANALSKGFGTYIAALTDPDAISAIRLTFIIAGIAVPLNLVFGIAASWAIARFEFPAKQ